MQRTIRTESAGISTARQSLDNVLSAKANLEQTSSYPQNSTDTHCALEFQIAELEGMLSEIMDERFARTIDESQWDDENRNVGLLNLIIDTADNMLASLSPPPPTYQKNHLNIPTTLSHAHKPKVESRDSSFPLPHDQRKRRRSLHTLLKRKSQVDHPTSKNTAHPFPQPAPAKPTNNSQLVGSPKPSNPFRNAQEPSQDSLSTDDLSLSVFQTLKQLDAFNVLVDRTDSQQIRDIDRDNLWFCFRDVFDDNLSKELFCAFEVLIRVSHAERASRDATTNSEEPTSRFTNKGKTPMRGTSSSVTPSSESPSSSPSPSESISSDFITIESPETTKPTPPQPPPYTQHITPPPPPHPPPTKSKPKPKSKTEQPISCINCGLTIIGNKEVLRVHSCGHVFCRGCAEELCREYVGDDDGYRGVGRCRCDAWVSNLDVGRFLDG